MTACGAGGRGFKSRRARDGHSAQRVGGAITSDNSKIVVFVRHGESTKNVEHIITDDFDGYPLTESGGKSARADGEELRRLPKVNRFYSSPVLRARQTADIISECINEAYEVDDLLRERGQGRYNGVRLKSDGAIRDLTLEQIRDGYPDFESWSRIQDRMMRFAGKLERGSVSIAVSHGDPIKSMVGRFLGRSEKEMLGAHMPKASLTVIDFGKRGASAVLAHGAKFLPPEVIPGGERK